MCAMLKLICCTSNIKDEYNLVCAFFFFFFKFIFLQVIIIFVTETNKVWEKSLMSKEDIKNIYLTNKNIK